MKNLLSNFVYNLKMYLKYIVKVGFKELFFDVLILVLMAIIAAFAYIPVGLVGDLVRGFITSFVSLKGVGAALYNWLVLAFQGICSILLFMYLFNNRYDFKNDKVVPIEGSYTLERKDDIELNNKDNKKVSKNEKNEFDLPKEKED